jgi:hypothetical protein
VQHAEADAFRPSLRLARREALWAIKALRDEPLPLFAAASGADPAQPSGQFPPRGLAPACASPMVLSLKVSDIDSKRMMLRVASYALQEGLVTFLAADDNFEQFAITTPMTSSCVAATSTPKSTRARFNAPSQMEI